MNVVLCGMAGCGKTTAGRQLAMIANLPFVDVDALISENCGDINEIFAKFGENYFREIEAEVVKEVCRAFSKAVISVGGGCVLREENVTRLKRNGVLVYLKASEQTLIERLKNDAERPLLKGGLEERVSELLGKRQEIYARVADVEICVDDKNAETVAKEIKEKVL